MNGDMGLVVPCYVFGFRSPDEQVITPSFVCAPLNPEIVVWGLHDLLDYPMLRLRLVLFL